MNVALIGRLSRDYALAWWAAKSALVEKVFLFPKPKFPVNLEGVEVVKCEETDIAAIIDNIKKLPIDLIIVSSEKAIAQGIADEIEKLGIPVFAPGSRVAFLQASKSEAKFFMQRNRIPTPLFKAFSEFRKAAKYARGLGKVEMVVKADGIANGKGTAFLDDSEDIVDLISDYMIEGRFGEASDSVVIESFVHGYEITVITVADGDLWKPIVIARTYRRLREGNRGPSTLGMGALIPFDKLPPKIEEAIISKIVEPTYRGIKNEGLKFKGILQFNIIVSETGPKLVSYEVRLGSPEGESLIHLLGDKFFELARAVASHDLNSIGDLDIEKGQYAVSMTIVPNTYPVGIPINSAIELDSVPPNSKEIALFWEDVRFQHGLAIGEGGRMAVVVARGGTPDTARQKAYDFAKRIRAKNIYFRQDIGS